jgi:hypothetical protein
MARTKQQARESIGGKAPRKLLATKAVRKAPNYPIKLKIVIDLTVVAETTSINNESFTQKK